MTTLEILTAARAKLAKGHTSGCQLLDAHGRKSHRWDDAKATAWSLAGAVNAAAYELLQGAGHRSHDDDVRTIVAAWIFVRAACSEHELWKNDVGLLEAQLSQAEVLVLMDRAIALAKGQSKRRSA